MRVFGLVHDAIMKSQLREIMAKNKAYIDKVDVFVIPSRWGMPANVKLTEIRMHSATFNEYKDKTRELDPEISCIPLIICDDRIPLCKALVFGMDPCIFGIKPK